MRDHHFAHRQTSGPDDDYLIERMESAKRPPLAVFALFGLTLLLSLI